MPTRRLLLRTPSAYRGTCAIGIITNKRYKATTIPNPIDSHFIFSLLNVPMCFASGDYLKALVFMLYREYICIKVRDPLFSLLGNSKVAQRIFDVGTYHLPEKLRIIGPQISGTVIFKPFAHAGFAELRKQCGSLAQIIDVGELADQIRRT